jgi:hypothetical protein
MDRPYLLPVYYLVLYESLTSMQSALYRASQFFGAIRACLPAWAGGISRVLQPIDETLVRSILPAAPQQQLFKQMAVNDQRHALAVVHTLQQAGHYQLPLMQAALLHDVAKSIGQPLVHRVLIVLLEAFWPAALAWLADRPASSRIGSMETLGNETPAVTLKVAQIGQLLSINPALLHLYSWWRRPFVIHAYHPAIGAIWAQEAGCDSLAVTLILSHQDKLEAEVVDSSQKKMLAALQWADGLN